MILPPLDMPIVCPVLVGRGRELATLARMIERAHGGAGWIGLIRGEAGVGKSRLVAEARAHAVDKGFQILQGRCFEQDRALPYAPLLDLLRAELGAIQAQRVPEALGPLAPLFVALLPEYAALLEEHITAAVDAEHERRRTVQAFVQLFSSRAGQGPLLVIVEDLHWCDGATIDVLLALARAAGIPLLVLCTYRAEEASPELTALLAELSRLRVAEELRLEPLKLGDVDAMLRAIFRQRAPIRSDFLSALHALTDGNPFFIEEVLTALIAAGDIYRAEGQWQRKPLGELDIPHSIQIAVQRRAERLGPEARRLLTLAAVAGRRFNLGLLRQLTGVGEPAMVEAIKALIAAQLVVEESADAFAFRHALTRAALYGELLARERHALHRAVVDAIEAERRQRGEPPEAWLADLAHHAFAAESWGDALRYARAAAEQARRLYVPQVAIEHLTHALEASRHLGLAPPADLLRARGQARETLGAHEAAIEDYRAALAAAERAGDRREQWRILLDIGFFYAAHDAALMGDYLRRALDLARAVGDPLLVGQSLNRYGNWFLFREQPREAQRHHQEALALFEAVGDLDGLATTYDLLGASNMMGSDIPTGISYYERAIALFRELDNPQGLSSALATHSTRGGSYLGAAMFWQPTSVVACVADGEEALGLAQQIGWRAGETGALVYLAVGHGVRGEYEPALERARKAFDLAREMEHGTWTFGANLALGLILLDLLAVDEARRHLEAAMAAASGLGVFFTARVAGPLATACAARHDLAGAERALNRLLDPATPMETQGQRGAWCGRAELALAAGDDAGALAIVERLIATDVHAMDAGPGAIPYLWYLRGEALTRLGRVTEAEAALAAAGTGAEARGLMPLCWRVQLSLGRLYQRQARRKRARACFESARATIDTLAAAVPDDALREHFLSVAIALIPRTPAPTRRRAAKEAASGLTERERDVVGLIAQGKINREIATALVVGERTVETHVGNILAKLGLSSRRQVAAWAREHGFGEPR